MWLRLSDCFISDTPFSVPDVSGLLESDTRSAALAERQDERSDCAGDGANEVVILVVLFVAVMQYGSLMKVCAFSITFCACEFSSESCNFLTSRFSIDGWESVDVKDSFRFFIYGDSRTAQIRWQKRARMNHQKSQQEPSKTFGRHQTVRRANLQPLSVSVSFCPERQSYLNNYRMWLTRARFP
jgi:hypothetical protein